MELRFEKNVVLNDYAFLLPFYLLFTACTLSESFAEDELCFIYERVSFLQIWWIFHSKAVLAFLMANSIGIHFSLLIVPRRIELKRRVKDSIDEFIAKTNLVYKGLSKFYAGNFIGVLHPYDHFMSQLMNLYAIGWQATCVATYVRTNSLLWLRLDQAEKFSVDTSLDEDIICMLEDRASEIYDDIVNLDNFDEITRDILFSLAGDFESLSIDGSSAAGYPFKGGVKRSKVKSKAVEDARQLLRDDDSFEAYMKEHVWYTTGRAKLQKPGDKLSARIICYPGFANMLINMLFYQPFHQVLERFDWCAVGMSWMNGGARTFAKAFGDVGGVAPEGFEYCSLDISGWDASMCSDLLKIIKGLYLRILHKMGASAQYMHRFSVCFDDMVNADLTFPGGYCFGTRTGMKSGWPDTSHCDTLGHDLVFSLIRKKFGISLYKLYGDDNFFLKPIGVSNEDIIKSYASCGFRVKIINSSKNLRNVDFLSKNIHYVHGEYLIYRDSVETFSRLLMPEEGNPADRQLPDEVIAAERLIGHLLDNPFNHEVRTSIYAMLEHLRDHYQIYSVDFSERLRKAYMFKPVNFDRITSVPITPSFTFIKELYGVGDVQLVTSWPLLSINVAEFAFSKGHRNMNHFQNACAYYRTVRNNVYSLGRANRVVCNKYTSPYASPKVVFGYHAARLAFAIKHFDIKFDDVVDFGSHPGACAALLVQHAKKVVGVSLIPEVDKKRRHPKICPYVLRNKKFSFVEADVDDYMIDTRVDLLHDDVDAVFVARDERFDIAQALASLRRFNKHFAMVKQAVMTIHDVNHEVIAAIYEVYRMYGGFKMVKTHFSNPWKPEFVLYFYKEKGLRMKKSDFSRSCYKYLNQFGASIVNWCNALNHNVERIKDGKECEICPYQLDKDFQKEVIDMIMVEE